MLFIKYVRLLPICYFDIGLFLLDNIASKFFVFYAVSVLLDDKVLFTLNMHKMFPAIKWSIYDNIDYYPCKHVFRLGNKQCGLLCFDAMKSRKVLEANK